ncbi:MAG: excinuclease ABC subunit UvrC [Chloroflexi bacterium]|nr:excinuclease ABC subunit UvrC [Chloroflexota bacterium]
MLEEQNAIKEQLQQRVKALPTKPGVYMFKDVAGKVIYVGKAVSLRNRVRSYFRAKVQEAKVRRMVEHAADVETIVTASELEALVLECTLIKRYRPRYNVKLRDDKNYPYIKVSMDEGWPRVYVTRQYHQDGARYFGPFTDSRSVRATLDLLNRLFPYRSCRKPITGTDPRPCLDYHIKRCLGPCIGAVNREDYLAVLKQVCLFLEGRQDEVIKQLRQRMEEASEDLKYERAAFLRDQIRAVEKVVERQRVISTAMEDEDVIAFARSNGEACVQVFFIRGGKLIGREHFVLEGTQDEDGKRIMTSFVTQFYDGATFVPPRILLQSEVDEANVIQSWLRERRGEKVVLQVPRRGEKRQLVDMVAENATEVLAQLRAKWMADDRKTGSALMELAEYLDLSAPPQRIECYDISNIRGTNAVGSMVVFEGAHPQNAKYRRFKIRGVPGIDDYAMMREVLTRRFKRAAAPARERETVAVTGGAADGRSAAREGKQEDDSWRVMPDLVMVDGGKGHLSAALGVMEELEVANIPVIALAKEREEVFVPGASEPLQIPRTAQSLYLLQRVRDEAHRFAISYHQRLRQRSAFESPLDEVPGVGPRRRAALLRQFGTLRGIREASLDDLAAAPGMTQRLASLIKQYLGD